MKSLIFASVSFVSLFSAGAFAGSLSDYAFNVANQIRQSERYLSPDQRNDIGNELTRIQKILNGGYDDEPQSSYTCVSRDNDGRNPWVLGVKQGVEIARIANAAFSTKEDCEGGLAKGRQVRAGLLVCASRDNDGRNPIGFVFLNEKNAVKLPNSAQPDPMTCDATLKALKADRTGVVFCGSRDNDGRAPFLQMDYRFNGQFTKGSEAYTSLNDCQANL